MTLRGMTYMLLIIISCLLVLIALLVAGRLDWPIQTVIDRLQNVSELRGAKVDNLPPDQSDQPFFSATYLTAKKRFVESAQTAGAKLSRLNLSERGPDNEELTIDIAWFGHPKPKRALVHVSGVHGVEGFAGAAIQLKLLGELPKLPADSALIFVHILNPYGMAWLRRYNESNVDLNRNFRFKSEDWIEDTSFYSKLDKLLNPKAYQIFDSFLLQAGIAIKKYGMDRLRNTIPTGQNFNPKGLFYYGSHLEQGPQLYHAWVSESLASLKYLMVIDVHTGLGQRGQESLFHKSTSTNSAFLSKQLKKTLIADYAESGAMAYAFKGGHVEAYNQLDTDCSIDFIAQEFGTYPNIYVLQALRDENRAHFLGQTELNSREKQRLKEAFNPQVPEWQSKIVEDGVALFTRSAEWFFK